MELWLTILLTFGAFKFFSNVYFLLRLGDAFKNSRNVNPRPKSLLRNRVTLKARCKGRLKFYSHEIKLVCIAVLIVAAFIVDVLAITGYVFYATMLVVSPVVHTAIWVCFLRTVPKTQIVADKSHPHGRFSCESHKNYKEEVARNHVIKVTIISAAAWINRAIVDVVGFAIDDPFVTAAFRCYDAVVMIICMNQLNLAFIDDPYYKCCCIYGHDVYMYFHKRLAEESPEMDTRDRTDVELSSPLLTESNAGSNSDISKSDAPQRSLRTMRSPNTARGQKPHCRGDDGFDSCAKVIVHMDPDDQSSLRDFKVHFNRGDDARRVAEQYFEENLACDVCDKVKVKDAVMHEEAESEYRLICDGIVENIASQIVAWAMNHPNSPSEDNPETTTSSGVMHNNQIYGVVRQATTSSGNQSSDESRDVVRQISDAPSDSKTKLDAISESGPGQSGVNVARGVGGGQSLETVHEDRNGDEAESGREPEAEDESERRNPSVSLQESVGQRHGKSKSHTVKDCQSDLIPETTPEPESADI